MAAPTGITDASSGADSANGFPSARLYSRELAPTRAEGRPWRAYNVFTLWANDVHSLGNYTFAIGLFSLGLGAWQILCAFVLGAVLLFVLLTLSGLMGHRTGVPFPVLARAAFGIDGAQVAAWIRGSVAIAWFGIQTYLASVVLRVMLIALWPGLEGWNHNTVLGLSTLGWVSFVVLWLAQVVIVSYGMAMVRRYVALAGPVILITMTALAAWMLARSDFSIALQPAEPLAGAAMWREILAAAALWVVIYGTFVLNFCDFTRSVRSRRDILLGNVLGIPVNMLFFAAIVVILAGAQFAINGQVIESPSDIVRMIPSTALLVAACLALIVLTVAVNLVANFVAPIYMLANAAPRVLDFKRAGWVSAVIGFAITPWNLYNTPVVIEYFLGGLGALLGPVFGVLMAEYWLVSKGCIDVPALYDDRPGAPYVHQHGFNVRAFIAFIPAALISLAVALLPALHDESGFSWFFGAILAAAIYALIADRKRSHALRRDGHAIAVASD